MDRWTWTDEMQDAAAKMRRKGMTYVEIAQVMGTTAVTVGTHVDEFRRLTGIWTNIRSRCYNPADPKYRRYGGRSSHPIGMYPPWRESSRKFAQDVLEEIGPRPSTEYSLDRVNNDLDYEPGNLKWSTAQEQALNRSNTSPWPNVLVTKSSQRKKSPWQIMVTMSRTFPSEKESNSCAKEFHDEFGAEIAKMKEWLRTWKLLSADFAVVRTFRLSLTWAVSPSPSAWTAPRHTP